MKGYVHRGLLRLDPSQAHSSFMVWANPKSGEPSDWIEVEVTQIGVCGVKSLEELAEKARLAFFDNDTSKCENRNKIGEANKEWWRTVTLAIIREVLGPVTEQEANDAFTTYNKHPSNNDVASFRAALNSIFASRLSHYTRTASPVEVSKAELLEHERLAQEFVHKHGVKAYVDVLVGALEEKPKPTDDEVERVARAAYEAFCNARGGVIVLWENTDKELWYKVARAAIAAMGGQKRWGVWLIGLQDWRAAAGAKNGEKFVTTDKKAAEQVSKEWNCHHASGSEVREYTPPAAEIPREAIEAAEAAYFREHKHSVAGGDTPAGAHKDGILAAITAAIRHLKGGE